MKTRSIAHKGQSCPTKFRNLATSTTLRANDQKSEDDDSTKTYIQDNPELERILKDLYDDQDREKLVGAMQTKFNVFKDDDSPVIYDVDEERERMLEKQLLEEEEAETDPSVQTRSPTHEYDKYGMTYGSRGVFDVDDLVDVLVGEDCRDVAVIAVPEELGYVDHMVIVTCKSKRHLRSSATFVKKMYKLRCQKLRGSKSTHDRIPRIEGIDDKDSEWLAIDLGNIALHCFLHQTRQEYDLETLWGVGPDFKTKGESVGNRSVEEMEAIMLQSQSLLADLEPAKTDVEPAKTDVKSP